MSAVLQWYQHPYVIYEQFRGTVTFDDIGRMCSEFDTVSAQVSPPVHTIVDLREVTHFPANLTKMRQQISPSDPSRGWIIVIVPENNPLLHFMCAYSAQLRVSTRYRVVRSLEEAVDFLNKRDTRLSLRVILQPQS